MQLLISAKIADLAAIKNKKAVAGLGFLLYND
jgi:hypothetical protein